MENKILTAEEILIKEEILLKTIEEACKQYILDEWYDSDEPLQFGIKVGSELGAKWQQEQDKNKYSEQEVFELLKNCLMSTGKDIKAEMKNIGTNNAHIEFCGSDLKNWFEQFKKK